MIDGPMRKCWIFLLEEFAYRASFVSLPSVVSYVYMTAVFAFVNHLPPVLGDGVRVVFGVGFCGRSRVFAFPVVFLVAHGEGCSAFRAFSHLSCAVIPNCREYQDEKECKWEEAGNRFYFDGY